MDNRNEKTSAVPSQDERVMAALAHVTAILPFVGIISPIVIWATQREKSPYIAFQALQALVYQLMMVLAWFAGMACYVCSFFGMFAGALAVLPASAPGEELSGPGSVLILGSMLVPFMFFGLTMVAEVVFALYGLVGAIQVLQGKRFRYAILGRRLERYLQGGEQATFQARSVGSTEERPEWKE